MTVTRSQALDIAATFIKSGNYAKPGIEVAVDVQAVFEMFDGFVIPWNSAAFMVDRNVMVGLVGNIPMLVDGATGTCRFLNQDELMAYHLRKR